VKLALAAALALVVGAVLGMLGGGGAILTTPMLAYVVGLEAKQAIVGSLFVVATTSAVSSIAHLRRGNVRLKLGLVFGGVGMAAAFAGGRATHLVPGSALLVLLSVVMLGSAITMLRKKKAPDAEGEAPAPVSLLKIAAAGAIVGGLSGFVGSGGGFLIVPALVLFGGVPMRQAVGTSLFIIAMQSTAGLLGQVSKTPVVWPIVSVVAACTVAGSFVGAALGARVPADTLRKAFAVLVLVVGVGMLTREAVRLAAP
jgi:uncharacterized membrane protein YfcA